VVLKEFLSFLTGETTKYNTLSLLHAVTNGYSIYLRLDVMNRHVFTKADILKIKLTVHIGNSVIEYLFDIGCRNEGRCL